MVVTIIALTAGRCVCVYPTGALLPSTSVARLALQTHVIGTARQSHHVRCLVVSSTVSAPVLWFSNYGLNLKLNFSAHYFADLLLLCVTHVSCFALRLTLVMIVVLVRPASHGIPTMFFKRQTNMSVRGFMSSHCSGGSMELRSSLHVGRGSHIIGTKSGSVLLCAAASPSLGDPVPKQTSGHSFTTRAQLSSRNRTLLDMSKPSLACNS